MYQYIFIYVHAKSDVWCRMYYIPYTNIWYIWKIVDSVQVQWHPTRAVWTAVWTRNATVCMRDRKPCTYFRCALRHVSVVPFRPQMNLFTLIEYYNYSMLDVWHGLHGCPWLGSKLAYTHPISSGWLSLFLLPVAACGHARLSAFRILAFFIHSVTYLGFWYILP